MVPDRQSDRRGLGCGSPEAESRPCGTLRPVTLLLGTLRSAFGDDGHRTGADQRHRPKKPAHFHDFYDPCPKIRLHRSRRESSLDRRWKDHAQRSRHHAFQQHQTAIPRSACRPCLGHNRSNIGIKAHSDSRDPAVHILHRNDP